MALMYGVAIDAAAVASSDLALAVRDPFVTSSGLELSWICS